MKRVTGLLLALALVQPAWGTIPLTGAGAPAVVGGGGGTAGTWDPADFVVADTFGNAHIQLTGSNLIATVFGSPGGDVSITSTRPVSGQCRFEVKGDGAPGLALAVHKTDASNGMFGTQGGLLWLSDGRMFIGFAQQTSSAPTYTTTDTLYIEVDTAAKLIYFGVNSGARSVGFDISVMSGALYPGVDFGPTNALTNTANFGNTWTTPVTAGYGAC